MDDMRGKRNKRRDLNEEHGMTRKIDPVEIFINPHVYYELHKSVAVNNKFGYLTYNNTFCGAMLKPKPHITIEDRWEIRFGDERPPLGITPRYIMDEIRFNEITTAIREYNKVDLPIPAAWMDEYNEILRRKGVNV
jgi:hypothetical protein